MTTSKTAATDAALAAAAEKRALAARQASKVLKPIEPPQIVMARVLKNGDGKISTGEHVSGVGEVHFEKGETFQIERHAGEALEERGFVEITEIP